MFKKIVLVSVTVLLLAAVTFITLHFRNLRQFDNNQAFKAISPDAPLVLVTHDILGTANGILLCDSLLSDLRGFRVAADLKNLVTAVIKTADSKAAELNYLLEKPCAITINPEADSLSYTFFFSFRDVASQKKFARWFKLVSQKEGSDIYSYNSNGRLAKIYAANVDGIFIASMVKKNIEQAMSQFEADHCMLSNPEFADLEKTVSNNATANLFINLEKFTRLTNSFFDISKQGVDFSRFGKWAAFDVDLTNNKLSLDGLVYIGQNQNNFFTDLFSGIAPSPSGLMDKLPSKTVMACCFNFGPNNDLTKRNVENYCSKTNYKPVNDSIYQLLNGSVCVAHLSSPFGYDKVLTLESQGQSKAMEQLNSFLYGSTSEPLVPDTHFEPNENVKIPIYKNLSDSVLTGSLGFLFKNAPEKYFSFYENQIIFADSIAPLTRFLYQCILDKILTNTPLYRTHSSNYPANSHFNFFVAPDYLPELLNGVIQEQSQTRLTKSRNQLANFYGLGLQICLSDNNLLLSQNLVYTPNYKQEPVTVWQSKLDTSLVMKPLLLFNPKSKQKDILVQDMSNKIYLIGQTGVITWEKKIDAQIIGDILQIDFSKNGNTQFAFTAGDKIHVIDHNGNNVPNFPIQLPSMATSPVAVFDYEKNGDLRFVVACKDRSVRLFDKKGNRLPDWSFKETEAEVTYPVQHFRTDGKDFIVVTDKNRFYILDRKGRERVSVKLQGNATPIAPLSLIASKTSSATLASVTAQGQLLTVELPSAKTQQTNMLLTTHGHCTLKALDNEKKTFLYGDNSSLAVVRNDGTIIWQTNFEEGLTSSPDIYTFGNGQKKIGVTSKANQIFLFNADGSAFPGFPMVGLSRFSIGYMTSDAENFNLIVAGKNHFLYNYEIAIQ